MRLTLYIDDQPRPLEVPDSILEEGADFFEKMDADMDKGWQMSREWIENPNREQRCQIAADKMLNAISAENETMILLMSGYILSRMPGVTDIHINADGEMMETELVRGPVS